MPRMVRLLLTSKRLRELPERDWVRSNSSIWLSGCRVTRVVLDAAAFDVINRTQGANLRDLLRRTLLRGGELWYAAVTLAEVARGISRTRDIETALARQHGGYRIRVLDTDQTVAKLVGAILYTAHSPIHRLADAHVLATCAPAELAVVITSDSNDITELSAALPRTRVVVRRP